MFCQPQIIIQSISVILPHSLHSGAAWWKKALAAVHLSDLFTPILQTCHLGGNSRLIEFSAMCENVTEWRLAPWVPLSGNQQVLWHRYQTGGHELNQLFVPGFTCSFELWLFMKELDSRYKWPELKRNSEVLYSVLETGGLLFSATTLSLGQAVEQT